MKRVCGLLLFPCFFLGLSSQAKTLNVRLVDPPVSLDWGGQATLAEAPILVNLCEGLYTYDYATKKLIPGVAASLKKSDDLKQYTFTIRKTAKWSDGRPIYAQDFVDGWKRVTSSQTTSIYSYYFSDVKTFEATSDRTLVVQLKRPNRTWESTTAFWPFFPVRKDLMEKNGTNWWHAGLLASSGPFTFESYEAGKKLVMKRNRYYLRHGSNIDEIDVYFIADHDAALKKYESKFFPFIGDLPFKLMSKLSKRKDFRFVPLMRHHLIAFNVQKYPLSNRDFRLAVLSAIQPKTLLPKNAISLKVGQTLIPPPLPGSEKPTAVPFDVAAAKKYLKKSGVVVTPTLKIRILTSIAEPFYSIGKSIQSQLSKTLGLNVDLAALQNQEYTAYMNLGDYNASLMSWTAKVVSPQDFLLPYSGEAPSNRTHFKSPFYDQWIFEGARAANEKDAAKSFYRAQHLLSAEEAVVNPLFYESSGALISPRIRGLHFNHMGLPIFKDVRLQ